jgi:hypothetical protein
MCDRWDTCRVRHLSQMADLCRQLLELPHSAVRGADALARQRLGEEAQTLGGPA